MLVSKNLICNANSPFLLRTAIGKWMLVSSVHEDEYGLKLELVESKNGNFCVRSIHLNEEPFYVGADVWELEYGSVLMTLKHPSLDDHPAQRVLQRWIESRIYA